MTSPTDLTKTVRANKKASMGKKRKNKLLKTGTTPPLFKLNKPTPHEQKSAHSKTPGGK